MSPSISIRNVVAAASFFASVGCGGPSPSTSAVEGAKVQGTSPMLPDKRPDSVAEPEAPAPSSASQHSLLPALDTYLKAREADFEAIPGERKKTLEQIAAFVRQREATGAPANLTFICTHNSRRSHMSQLWAQAAAMRAGKSHVHTFSGGTEATAFNPRAVAALQRAGFDIAAPAPAARNPRYQVRVSPTAPPLEAFSKKYGDPPNPAQDFVAVMTCSEADKSCPTVSGAALRVSLPYIDPKVSDGSAEEAATYDARAAQIATEMAYLASRM